MATVVKNFKVKSGLIVEGTTGTINNYDILTKSSADQNYIIGLIGGSATPDNTPDSVVLRNEFGSFSAQDLTLDGSLYTTNIENNSTVNITSNSGDIVLNPDGWATIGGTQPGDRIATRGRVDALIGDSSVDSSTGNTITDRINDAASSAGYTAEFNAKAYADGLASNYDPAGSATTAQNNAESYTDGKIGTLVFSNTVAGEINTVATGTLNQANQYTDTAITNLNLSGTYDALGAASTAETNAKNYADSLASNYDAAGSAQGVQNNLDDHAQDTTTHGVTGNIVGTSDTQTLTNKTIGDQLTFNDGSNNSTIDVDGNNLYVNANNNLTLSTANGDIVLNADGGSYIGSVSAGNEIATNAYVDNAVSGLTWKTAVNLLSTTDISLSNQQSLTIDGHSISSSEIGYRILLTGQTSDSENGIYEVIDGGQGTIGFARSTDADAFSELVGSAVFVMEGTQFGQTSWVQSNHYLTDFTAQDWVQFSGTGSVVAGSGITVNGLEVSVDRTTVDGWYEYNGATADHNATTSGVHGISGDVVGTTDTQTLSNKTLETPQVNGEIQLHNGNGTFMALISANNDNLYFDTDSRDIILNPEGASAYIGSASSGNEIATQSYVDNAVPDDTDGLNEGLSNLYYTANRAKAEAANLLVNANKTNIVITKDINNDLTITAENGVADSTTSDLAEGSNLYFTDSRAKSSAADLLTSANLTNITISGNGSGLTITAENGVADSTTDDLEEGINNLYFTDGRARNALSAGDGISYNPNAGIVSANIGSGLEIANGAIVVDTDAIADKTWVSAEISTAVANGDSNATPQYQAVDITWATQQAASYTSIPTASTATVFSWSNYYASAKFLVRVRSGNHSQISEVLVTADNSGNLALTEYAMVGTNGNLGNVSVVSNGGQYDLTVETTESNSEVIVSATLMAYGD